MNKLKGKKIITSCLANFERRGGGGKSNFCAFHTKVKKKKKKGVTHSSNGTNLLKNLCNKNIINDLDPINLIENLKHVTECSVGEDVIRNYLYRVKLLNEQWSLNKIYFIFKTLVKYNLRDVVLMNKLEKIVNDLVPLCQVNKAQRDPFENVYIVRISYILHAFCHFGYSNCEVVKTLVNILSTKLDYIIYYSNYASPVFNDYALFCEDKGHYVLRGDTSAASSPLSGDKTNNEAKGRVSTIDMNDMFNMVDAACVDKETNQSANLYSTSHVEWQRSEEAFVRNINFNEIYLIVNTLKDSKYTNKVFLNKLKFLFYFNCINLDRGTDSHYKYVTLLFNFFYEPDDMHLLNIVKFFLINHPHMNNVHDLVLTLVTVYYGGLERRGNLGSISSSRNGTGGNVVHKEEYINRTHKKNLKYTQGDDIVSIIEGIPFIPNGKKEKLKKILQHVNQHISVSSTNIFDLIYDKVLHVLSYKYEEEEFEGEGTNDPKLLQNVQLPIRRRANEASLCRNDKSSELQSLTELVKIRIFTFGEVDPLFYLYLKNKVQLFNIDAVLNIMKSFIFVYQMQNELKKNYHRVHLSDRYTNVVRNNLGSLTSLIIQMVSSMSLDKLYSLCSLKDLSMLLYFFYQIGNIFMNQKFEELYLKKVQSYVDSIVITKLKLLLGGGNLDGHSKKGISAIVWGKKTEKCDVKTGKDDTIHTIHANGKYSNEKKEVLGNRGSGNYQHGGAVQNHLNIAKCGHDKGESSDEYFPNVHCPNSECEEQGDPIDAHILLLNMYSKRGQNKNIIHMLLEILNRRQVGRKIMPCTIYVNLLNSFAKLRYRNLDLIGTCLQRISEHLGELHFFEYTNLLISLSKLNVFAVNLSMYDGVFFPQDGTPRRSTYQEETKKIFLNEYNSEGTEKLGEEKIVSNLNKILKQINESISVFVPVPNYKMANVIPNMLSSYTVLGFDKIDFKNVNKLLECLYEYVFGYFEEGHLSGGCKELPSSDRTRTVGDTQLNEDQPKKNEHSYLYQDILTCMNNPLRKNHYWYFNDKNNITVRRRGTNETLYLPIQCLYQVYIFNVYFMAYVQRLFSSHGCDKVGSGELPIGEALIGEPDRANTSPNHPHSTNLYLRNNPGVKGSEAHTPLSERSRHILNNITFFVKYINNFFKNKKYERYNLSAQFVHRCDDKGELNEQLINYVKNCSMQIKRDFANVHSSSFHREVLSTLLSLDVKNVQCEVPFMDGIYTVDIVINNSVCIEINGSNHYYYDNNLKRSGEKLDALNLIKYYLLSKKYKLILVSYLDWNNLKSAEEKKDYLVKRICA
ncbi:RAP protein, putative [Plasmodium knowlesi strain H]|uniref:RAP protein, putative n=3 Tax=Plasmodium knowlesi TaxID=5850 RepID=A0A5K1V825_PLAKH|nr:RAP protein, putative [Plasmodium knowlesi strain H]OTN64692.1 putative RAP protein [Plasmodium knowlesi]CAA9989037.1 RAP protein, putative [Plasmodium knowlesi strain H]SBO27246.1 RAP protein, putative [Plasmodium knowlesi strain H]SBO28878.1 RAP protein, putative [Plasmodium knowlesi strain H]VVS78511.1 RAP protein, putative [Plasmodium knowlesi strain H]|eukprot:XP_002261386.1 hypothetical protein, conserved in Plasmodium species [Plasmodium knowlesi strain H]